MSWDFQGGSRRGQFIQMSNCPELAKGKKAELPESKTVKMTAAVVSLCSILHCETHYLSHPCCSSSETRQLIRMCNLMHVSVRSACVIPLQPLHRFGKCLMFSLSFTVLLHMQYTCQPVSNGRRRRWRAFESSWCSNPPGLHAYKVLRGS